ncbi:TrbI/VirB10 family protein [Stutzerimonas kunmingensis]|uniref:TrbI/VirB10 family protein n=1 Tax=Stutzerimonas kunmingensis TaxID=1211807 RepID=UPI0028AE77C9|nr:TrbI/VirB10 family protein [Stutzerimonas kunmingensis]
MADEADPRIQEKPATHKSKVRRYMMATIGVVFLILFGNFLYYQYERATGQVQRKTRERPQPEVTSTVDKGRFDSLVAGEQARLTRLQPKDPQPAAADPIVSSEAVESAWNNVTDGKEALREPTELEKLEAKWKANERMRALKAASSDWGYSDSVKKTERAAAGGTLQRASASRAGSNTSSTKEEAQRLLDSPMPESGTLEERRAEVARRIDAARRLRASLRQETESGADEGSPVVQQKRAELQQVEAGFDQPPPDIAGYAKSNTYNADVEGKKLLPPGTEIPAQFMRKGVSDFQGSQLKGIVSRDVYDLERENVLIPKGSEVIMRVVKAGSVNEAIQHRMGITTNWVILPDGRKIDLSKAAGLDREGVGAIADQVDYHILAQFLGVAAYAVVGSNSSYTGSGTSEDATFAGDVGEGSRKQASNIAQKYLNIVPTVTIRPGQSFYVSTEEDIYIEPWRNVYESYVN